LLVKQNQSVEHPLMLTDKATNCIFRIKWRTPFRT